MKVSEVGLHAGREGFKLGHACGFEVVLSLF